VRARGVDGLCTHRSVSVARVPAHPPPPPPTCASLQEERHHSLRVTATSGPIRREARRGARQPFERAGGAVANNDRARRETEKTKKPNPRNLGSGQICPYNTLTSATAHATRILYLNTSPCPPLCPPRRAAPRQPPALPRGRASPAPARASSTTDPAAQTPGCRVSDCDQMERRR